MLVGNDVELAKPYAKIRFTSITQGCEMKFVTLDRDSNRLRFTGLVFLRFTHEITPVLASGSSDRQNLRLDNLQ
jgi:hypothetical protein